MINKFSKATPSEKKQYLLKRLDNLKTNRQPWLTIWQDVSRFIAPFNGRFMPSDHLHGRNFDYIFDNEAKRNLQYLAAGLSKYASSPAVQWFKLLPKGLKGDDLSFAGKRWASDVERIVLKTFQNSNTYNSLYMLYEELCLFGIAVDLITENDNHVLSHMILNAGEYCVAVNKENVVDTLYREFQLTTANAVKTFGYDKVSSAIKQAYDNGDLDTYFTFCQAIEPRADRDLSSKLNIDMPYASYYFELDSTSAYPKGEILSESGYKYFPAVVPRWKVINGEAYGLSPAMESLPNIKQLQIETECKTRIVELLADPPVQAPLSARQEVQSILPGSINYNLTEQPITPVYQPIPGSLEAVMNDILQLKQSIKSDFFADIILALSTGSTSDRKTAAEIYLLRDEKMSVLGNVYERLQDELLKPLIQITLQILNNKQLIPPMPNSMTQTMQDDTIAIEFQSMLAQSQRAVDVNAIDRFLQFVFPVSQVNKDIIDNINFDALFKKYAECLAIDPYIIKSDDEVSQVRQERQAMEQQIQSQQQANMNAQTLQQLAQAQKYGVEAGAALGDLSQVGNGGLTGAI